MNHGGFIGAPADERAPTEQQRPRRNLRILASAALLVGLVGCTPVAAKSPVPTKSKPAATATRSAKPKAVKRRTSAATLKANASAVARKVASASTAGIVAVPATIDATGTTDVTWRLLSFFATVPDGSTIAFPAGATYRVDGTLKLTDRNGLTIDGNGATFKATTNGDRGRRHWHFHGGSNITVRDLVVRGAHPNAGKFGQYVKGREAQHGFDFWGVRGVLVENVKVYDVFGDFVYFGMDQRNKARQWTTNAVVRNSTFNRSGRQGITINAGENVYITGNSINDVRRSTFDIEPNGGAWGVRHVRIVGNRIGVGKLNFVANHGSRWAVVDDVQIVDNVLRGKAMKMYFRGGTAPKRRRANLVIEGNVSDKVFGSGRGVIEVENFDGVVVQRNVQPFKTVRHGNKRMTAVKVKGSCRVTVAGNTFTGLVVEKGITSNYRC